MPSIFNDVIGPVMRGPSSSHTAASHRIGAIIRQICSPENGKVCVEFDRHGSLATTFEGQGSAMGLISGLLGLSILDRDMTRYKELAKERKLDIRFEITDFENTHPNTYRISVETLKKQKFTFTAVSTGGGMIEFINLNGHEISLKGDFFETLICFNKLSENQIKVFADDLKKHAATSEISLSRKVNDGFLIEVKSTTPFLANAKFIIDKFTDVSWTCELEPVMPVAGGGKRELPFYTDNEMLDMADLNGMDLADLAILYESARSGMEPEKVLSMMLEIVQHIRNSVKEGLSGTVYTDRILGQQSHLIIKAEKENRIFRTPMNTIIAYVTALMEAKSSMGIIVAAPTAGSSGVLGGAILGVAEGSAYTDDQIARAFMASGIIGVFIADKYTFAAESGGCQVECGAASGMAAAGLVQLMGGSARQAVNAASIALQNLLGLICDPVADRVEVPCLGKNILGAGNALNSANMSIAGFDHVIPLDEVIGAMKSVGDSMPPSLCCTGLGGLSITPTAIRIQESLKLKNKK